MKLNRKDVTMYTDGSITKNPGGIGGCAAILLFENHRKELSEGNFECTTNNRMELQACIIGLKALNQSCNVVINTDSQYVIKVMTMHKKFVVNNDLITELKELCRQHKVKWEWVRGHNGNPENERCDQLAKESIGIWKKKGK